MKIREIFSTFVLFVLLAGIYSVDFEVVVTDDLGTLLVDFTTVDIMEGKTVLYSKNTDHENASVKFDLAAGDYFVRLKRPGYPDHIYLKQIYEDERFEAKMLRNSVKSTYTIFGKVISDEEDRYTGKKIFILKKGAKWREYTIKSRGQYIFDVLLPEERYSIKVGSGDEEVVSAPFTYSTNGAFYIELDTTSKEFVSTKPVLSAPTSMDVKKTIVVSIRAGESVVKNAQILATTPDGEIDIYTDGQGNARVFAPKAGIYEFRYEDQIAKTSVISDKPDVDEDEKEIVETVVDVEDDVTKIEVSTDGQAEQRTDAGILLFSAGAAGFLMIGFLLFCLFVMGLAIYKLVIEKDDSSETEKKHAKRHHHKSKKKKKR